MVFVPASEKGDESDYTSLIAITEKLTGLNIDTIKVTDYNAAVEAMRAGRAHIAWYGGKTYVKAAEIANEGITLEYDSGNTRTTLDVIQSRSLLLDARIAFAKAERDFVISEAELSLQIGTLSLDSINIL